VGIASLGLGSLFGKGSSQATATPVESPDPIDGDPFGASLTSGEAASPSPEELASRPGAVPGTRPELTRTKDFYRIDINVGPVPSISTSDWRLVIGGLVENELELTMDELREMPSVTQILTMQCISNSIGGDLTGTTRWTGVRLKDVLAKAGLMPKAKEAFIRSADDFFEGVKMDDIMDGRTLLVYDMDGLPLPEKHGYPLRIYIPNRYGMKQPKWIESIHIVDDNVQGYWVIRGWSKDAYVRTTSVVDTVQVDMLSEGDVENVAAGGIAWAGARGISKVEVQVDDGAWEEAELRSPPLSPLSWVQWRYNWSDYQSGKHEFRVRCYDGDGKLQITEDGPPRPDGATGIHSYPVRI
jgi:DMSO/TMAO reductase YedYZ molybdopterin-dependent catalytic subunit